MALICQETDEPRLFVQPLEGDRDMLPIYYDFIIVAVALIYLVQQLYLYKKTKILTHKFYSVFFTIIIFGNVPFILIKVYNWRGGSSESLAAGISAGIFFVIAIFYFWKKQLWTSQKNKSSSKSRGTPNS